MHAITNFLLIVALFLSFISPLAAEEKTSPNAYPVGELGSLWQFPSDHLPVGGKVGNINFVMWNILNTDYLHHIIGNAQGLNDSLIMTANVAEKEEGLFTLREAMVVKNVFDMIDHPHTPRALIALQETGTQVFEKLQQTLPAHMKLMPSTIENLMHGDIFIYNANVFDVLDFSFAPYNINPHNTMMTLTLMEKETGLIYRFFQSHVPGGPINSDPARKELADALFDDYNPQAITLVMGDMNRSPEYFLENFAAAAKERETAQPFKNMTIPYPSHINTHREASWIDNIFISNPFEEICIEASKSDSFFVELEATVELLQNIPAN